MDFRESLIRHLIDSKKIPGIACWQAFSFRQIYYRQPF